MNTISLTKASHIKGLKLHRKMETNEIADYLQLDPTIVQQVLDKQLLPISPPTLEEFLPEPVQAPIQIKDCNILLKAAEKKIKKLESQNRNLSFQITAYWQLISFIAEKYHTSIQELTTLALRHHDRRKSK
jgi:hypothetical protein